MSTSEKPRMTSQRRAEIETIIERNYMWSDEFQAILDELDAVTRERDESIALMRRFVAQFTTDG